MFQREPTMGVGSLMRAMKWIALMATCCALGACGGSAASRPSSQSTSPATDAAHLCSSVFGSHYINSAMGTVGDVRTITVGPGYQPGKDAFVGVPDGQVAAWCWTGTSGDYKLYAVVQGHPPLKVEGLAVARAPAPGPAPIP